MDRFFAEERSSLDKQDYSEGSLFLSSWNGVPTFEGLPQGSKLDSNAICDPFSRYSHWGFTIFDGSIISWSLWKDKREIFASLFFSGLLVNFNPQKGTTTT